MSFYESKFEGTHDFSFKENEFLEKNERRRKKFKLFIPSRQQIFANKILKFYK